MNDPQALEKNRQALVSLAREASAQIDGETLARGLATVRQRLETQRKPRFSRTLAWAACALAVAALCIALGTSRYFASPLAYRVDGAEIERAGYVSGQAAVHFSDGSELKLEGRARARIASVDSEGAQVELEEGVMHADIVHRERTRWRFEAGPFSIHVRGTSFSVDWSGAEGRLEVRLRSGLLDVQTPFSQAPVSIHSGQRLVATLRDRQVILRALDEETRPKAGSVGAADAPAPSAPPALALESDAPSLVARAAASATEPRPSWASRMASGNWRAILDEALQQGVDVAVVKRSSDELALLAAAARYGSRADVARRALVAQRDRFGGSTHAKDAAFLLGRIDESANAQSALSWYERYLAEAPNGAYAAEAMGRKMLTTRRVLGEQQARPIAESYLRRWPNGAHASAARTLLGTP